MIPFHFTTQAPKQQEDSCVILPPNLESKTDLFAFLSHAIPLPGYFGHNWDALDECLGDLSWLDHQKIVLLHQDFPLEKTPADQRIYLQILADAARQADRITIIFPEKYRSQITGILSVAE